MSQIENIVENMKSGDIKFIGSNYSVEEMKIIYSDLLDLERKKIIDILLVHRESKSGNRDVDSVKIEKR